MKKALSLLLCILIGISFSSCAGEGVNFEDYPKTEFAATEFITKAFPDFTFRYPSEWSVEIEESTENIRDAGTVFGCFAPHGESGYPASFLIVIAKNQQVETTDIKKEYVMSLLEDMQKQTGNAYEITDFGYYYLGGEKMVIYSAKTTVETDVEAVVTQAMYVKDGTLYIFNLNTYDGENAQDANAVLSSVLFKSAQDPEDDSHILDGETVDTPSDDTPDNPETPDNTTRE